MSAAIGQQDSFEPGVRGQAEFECVIGGIVDENRLVGFHEEKELIAIDQADGEALVDARLGGEFAVEVDGGVEGIVRRGDVMGQSGGGELGLAPIVLAECVGEFFAIKTNFPGKDSVILESPAIVFQDCGIVIAREGRERELPVVIELNEIGVTGGAGSGIRILPQRRRVGRETGDSRRKKAAFPGEACPWLCWSPTDRRFRPSRTRKPGARNKIAAESASAP